MTRVRGLAMSVAFALAGATVGAWGVEVGKGVARGAGQIANPQTPRLTEKSHAVREGVVTRIDLPARRLEIQGHWHTMVWGQTQIFQNGHSARPDALKVGQAIRYSVSESEAGGKHLGVLYVP